MRFISLREFSLRLSSPCPLRSRGHLPACVVYCFVHSQLCVGATSGFQLSVVRVNSLSCPSCAGRFCLFFLRVWKGNSSCLAHQRQMSTKWLTHQQLLTDAKPRGRQGSPETGHLGHGLLLSWSPAESAGSPRTGRLLREGWVQDSQLLCYWKYSAGWARPILKKFIVWIVPFPRNFPLTVQEKWRNGSA